VSKPFVPAERQLVVEIYVTDLAKSLEFYERLGFVRERVDSGFAVVSWEGCQLFLDQHPVEQMYRSTANVRIMVEDVDRFWRLALEIGATITSQLAPRYYGLRDFIMLDPDGLGLRFATPLEPGKPPA